jgi:hypothetical protein
MEFYIKKNATLPLLKLQVVKDGRSDYNRFMSLIETSAIFFSMVSVETGIPKITSKQAGFVSTEQINPDAPTEYYIYYQFTNRDTNKPGRYEGQFMLRTDDGVLILPIREQLFINIQESFIADDLEFENCFLPEYPCCSPVIITTTTTIPVTTTTTTQPTPILINPIITDNNEYIVVGDNEYLMFVDGPAPTTTTTTTEEPDNNIYITDNDDNFLVDYEDNFVVEPLI